MLSRTGYTRSGNYDDIHSYWTRKNDSRRENVLNITSNKQYCRCITWHVYMLYSIVIGFSILCTLRSCVSVHGPGLAYDTLGLQCVLLMCCVLTGTHPQLDTNIGVEIGLFYATDRSSVRICRYKRNDNVVEKKQRRINNTEHFAKICFVVVNGVDLQRRRILHSS